MAGSYNNLLRSLDSAVLERDQLTKEKGALEVELDALDDQLDALLARDEPWVAQFL